ncbi:MAG: hypothetical protein ABW185_13740 [Sedimenticola sp.]
MRCCRLDALAAVEEKGVQERHNDRKKTMAYAYRTGAYSMQAIADYFCVGRMTVSRAIKQSEIELHNVQWET